MSNTYKTAFIGCGQRGRAHAAGMRVDPRCDVVALVDVNEKSSRALAADFGFSRAAIESDHLAMLDRHRPDIVVISLWTPLHLPVFRDCAALGVKAVHCEKPMAPTWGDCLEMSALAKSANCLLTFAHQRRYAEVNRHVRTLLEEGVFGNIERMDLYTPPNLLDCGTHLIDQAMSFNRQSPGKWTLGNVDCSETINWFNVRAECMAIGTIVFENGVRASLQTGGPDKDILAGVRVTGSEGFIEVTWDGQIKRAVIYRDPGWQVLPKDKAPADDVMIAMVADVIDSLETGRPSEISCENALKVTEIIFALYESSRRRARVNLPLTGVTDNPLHSILDRGA